MKVDVKVDKSMVVFDRSSACNMMVTLVAPDLGKDFKRNPLNICAVIDISGSMAGVKLEHVKKSMYKLIDNLTDEDSLSIVFFDNQMIPIEFKKMSSAAKDMMKKEVSNIMARGSTDIGSALRTAISLFASYESGEKSVDRIMLLTDGEANIGVVDKEGFTPIVRGARKGVSLSCFGYGADFNEALLAHLSKEGKGSNYFIESPDSVAKVFAVELGGLLTCYAQEIALKITPHKGAKVVNVLNDFDVKTGADEEGDSVTTVSMDDIYHGEKRNVLVRIECEKRDQALPRPITVADISVSYRTVKENKVEKQAGKCKLTLVKTSAEATSEPDKEVAEQVALLEAATLQMQAKQFADSGDFVQARVVYSSAIDCLNRVGTDATKVYALAMDEMSSTLDAATYTAGGLGAKSLSAMSGATKMSRCASYAGYASASAFCATSNDAMDDLVKSFTDDKDDDGDDSKGNGKKKV